MRKATRGITATVALLAAAALVAIATATWLHRGPMNHWWDWPWHDSWQSRLGTQAATSVRPDGNPNRNTDVGESAPSQEKRGVIPHAPLLKTVLPGAKNLETAVYETEYAPGGINPRHLHPAAITFYVVSGTGVWQEDGKPAVTLHAGESLFVPAGTIHSHWNPSNTDPLRFLEFIVAEKDKGGSIPCPTQNMCP